MDKETAFTGDENGTDNVTPTDNDTTNVDDDNSDNESCNSYDILPSEDFHNNEFGGNSENKDVDVDNVQNSFPESFADNLSQEGSDGPSGDDDEAEVDIEEAQRQQQMLETHWKVMEMTFRSEGDAYNFYNKHARERGFSIRRQKVKRGEGPEGIIRFRRFLCSRAGRRQARFITMEGRSGIVEIRRSVHLL